MPAKENGGSSRTQYVQTLDGKRHEIDDRTAMVVQSSRQRFKSISVLKEYVEQSVSESRNRRKIQKT